MRILIVEDNPDIVANLFGYLEPLGHTLDTAANGYAGLSFATDKQYDVIVLDVMLPGLNGIEVCERLRKDGISTPVLMLTARDTLEDKVLGFGSGADDYLVKPFSLVELEVRLKALIRRASGLTDASATLSFGDLRYDVKAYRATRAGRQLTLTKTGFIVLESLMRAAPAVVTREALENAIWGEDRPRSDALRTHMHAIRQTLDKPERIQMLQTVSGVGFKLVVNNETI